MCETTKEEDTKMEGIEEGIAMTDDWNQHYFAGQFDFVEERIAEELSRWIVDRFKLKDSPSALRHEVYEQVTSISARARDTYQDNR